MKELLDGNVLAKDPKYEGIYIFDIEVSPNWGTYYNEWKVGNIVWKEELSFITCFAITELGSGKVEVFALPDYKQWKKVFCKHCGARNFKDVDEDLVKKLWEYFDKAKILIGHNIDKFDIRKVNARFIKYGFEPPSPYKTIDTYKKHKQIADTSGNSLNNATKYYGIGQKLETEKNLAQKCLEGDMSAWKKYKEYNKEDVIINEKLYLKERGWYKSTPNLNIIMGTITNCPQCGSEHLNKKGTDYNGVTLYQRYKCMNCGLPIRGEKEGTRHLFKSF